MRILLTTILAAACSGATTSDRVEPDPAATGEDTMAETDALPQEAEPLLDALRAARGRDLEEEGAVEELMALAQHAANSRLLVGLEMDRVEAALHEPPHSGPCTADVNACTDAPASARWYSIGRRGRSLGIVPTLVVEPTSEGRVATVRASFPR